ncbi:MAG: cellulase family glycosylhydrolase [Chitinophagaceae bacterium]
MKLIRLSGLVLITALLMQSTSCKEQAKTSEKKEAVQQEVAAGRGIWTKEQANAWYEKQPWLVGCNFIPSTAINELEMFQAETFDTATINRELGWASAIGMNTVRVYLHDLLWQQDADGFQKRLETFLVIASRHHIKPVFVLFDSCWDPFPKPGKQREPKPFVHNSGWVQSPGHDALLDSMQQPRLEKYVKGVVAAFANDARVLAWDVWNEPDNTNNTAYGHVELQDKTRYVIPLLQKTFTWARSVNPSQPLTCGVWAGDWSSPGKLKPIEKIQLDESDIISFHNYENGEEFEKRIKWLQPLGRPIICTEYMARGNNSYFESSLPIAKKYKVGAINWGLVDGKSQTKYAWDSWEKTYTSDPALWFHEIFHTDGKPYKKKEVEFITKLTSEANGKN